MIRSMTGFGRGEVTENNRKFTVEMKAVNHRYFDVNIRMPKSLSFFEASIRSTLKEYIQRGKVDVFITMEDYSEGSVSLRYNGALAAEYLKYYRQMAQDLGMESDVRLSTIGRCPDVFVLDENTDNEDEIFSVLNKALTQACVSFRESREREGENLKADLLEKLSHMQENVELVKERYPQIVADYTARLEEKVKELLGDRQIDEARLAAELVIFSDKICTDEETVRLTSHIDSMKAELEHGGSVGRKLDFIAQEMNREANTILSKANDLATSNIAIDLKTEIEKVREQIQNIE
ncbi:MAG: YicC family protein [Lachnospiraceae bacterium]|nr:YicC family protein [Lachnospiraceae bacterium]